MGMGAQAMLRSGAFRATRAVRLDWAALSSKVTSDAGKSELNNLRATYAELVKAADAAPETPHSIDWAKWEQTIKTPGVVAEFKAAYSKLSIPAMEDTFTPASSPSLPPRWKRPRVPPLPRKLASRSWRASWPSLTTVGTGA